MAGLLKEAAEKVRKAGAAGSRDKVLAHITAEEAALLKSRGGSGRIDPLTGLPHFDDTGDGEEGPGNGPDYGDDSGSGSDDGISDPGSGSDSGPDSGWSGGLSGALGLGVSDDEGKGGKGNNEGEDDGPGRGVEYGEPDDTYSGKADPNEEDARNNYNAALGGAYRGSVDDARTGGRGDANFANTDLNESRAGAYAGALNAAGLSAHEAAVGGIGMRGADNGTDLGADFGTGYGGRGEQNSALAAGGYGYGERAGEFGALDAALNWGPWSQVGLTGLLAAATLANPFAGVAYGAANTAGKGIAGGDISLGDIGNVVSGGLGAQYGALAGIGAKTANDIAGRGMDATQSVAGTMSGLLGGAIGSGIGGNIGGGFGNDLSTAIGGTFGSMGGQALSNAGANAAGNGASIEGGGSGEDTLLSSSLGLSASSKSSGINPKRTTIKLN